MGAEPGLWGRCPDQEMWSNLSPENGTWALGAWPPSQGGAWLPDSPPTPRCWLRVDNYFIWSFIGPVAFVILVRGGPGGAQGGWGVPPMGRGCRGVPLWGSGCWGPQPWGSRCCESRHGFHRMCCGSSHGVVGAVGPGVPHGGCWGGGPGSLAAGLGVLPWGTEGRPRR